jgi:hypothetical protein
MTRWQCLLTAVGVALGAGPACGLSTETQLTPGRSKANGLTFQVTARAVGEAREVEVVIRPPRGKEWSPFLEARLSLYQGKRLVLSCPVEPKRQGSELRYRFLVSPKEVGKVRFRFNEYAFAKVMNPNGTVKILAMPAVDAYWFHLRDFLGDK